jgi:hypothetical protein
VDPRAGLDAMEKRKFLTLQDSNSDRSVGQPLATLTLSRLLIMNGMITLKCALVK